MEDELEKAVEEVKEVENLDDVDIGLPDSDIINIVANERFQVASAHQLLKVRLSTVQASVVANNSVGNTKEAEKFKTQEQEISIQMKHCLRGIKTIDREYPKAKARMLEMIAKRKE